MYGAACFSAASSPNQRHDSIESYTESRIDAYQADDDPHTAAPISSTREDHEVGSHILSLRN